MPPLSDDDAPARGQTRRALFRYGLAAGAARLGVSGSLIRNERPVAAALMRVVLEGGREVCRDPKRAAEIFAAYGGKGSPDDIANMLRSHTHNHSPVGVALKDEIAAYAEELKVVLAFKPGTNASASLKKSMPTS